MTRSIIAAAALLFVVACQTEEPAIEAQPAGSTETIQSAKPVEAARAAAPAGAIASIITPEDGDTVSGEEVRVIFGLHGMGVAPAGVDFPETGHHHLLVNVTAMPNMDLPIPADANHIHFGKGQTETILNLPPGTHTLQMLLGDYRHIPHDPPVISEPVTITVE